MKLLRKYKLTILGLLLGAITGFLYQHYKGCSNGSCLITGSPVVSTLYGALTGALVFSASIDQKARQKQKTK